MINPPLPQQIHTALRDIMHFSSTVLVTLLASTATVTARDVPANVRSFYNKVKNQDKCPNQLQGGFHSRDNDNKGMPSPFPQHRRFVNSC
jgi:hypothetical protein